MFTRFHALQIALCAAIAGAMMLAAMTVQANSAAEAQMYKGYDTPPYTVEAEIDGYEIRTYGRHIVAEVTVGGSQGKAVGAGFRTLAGYIFGGNEGGQKIAMTSPVTQVPQGDGWTIRFMMPPDYDLADLPAAQSDAVRFVEVDGGRHVVRTFGGWATASRLAANEAALRDWAAKQGLKIAGEAQYHFYDDPFTVPWNRRNEVAFPLS